MEITGQDWGLALLFSIEPTDRALAGWSGLTPHGRYLRMLARESTMKRCPTCNGSGVVDKDKPPRRVICDTCDGMGQVPK